MSETFDDGVTLTVQISFDAPSVEPPTWVDLTDKAQQIQIERGRSYELDDFQAGRATVRFDNRDRMLDPTFSGSYSGLLPMARLRIQATYDGDTYPIFYGFINSWPTTYDKNKNAYTDITAFDALAVLNQDVLETSHLKNALTKIDPYVWYAFEETNGSTVIVDKSGNGINGIYGTGSAGGIGGEDSGTINYQQNPVPFGDADGKSVDLEDQWPLLFDQYSVLKNSQFNRLPSSKNLLAESNWTVAVAWTKTSSDQSTIFSTCRDFVKRTGGGGIGPTVLSLPSETQRALTTYTNTVKLQHAGVEITLTDTNFTYTNSGVYFALITRDNATISMRVLAFDSNGILKADKTGTNTLSGDALSTDPYEVWLAADRGYIYDIWTSGINIPPAGQMAAAVCPLRGRLDEFAYWNRTLNATEQAEIVSAYSAAWPNELTGARINRVLDTVSWSSTNRSIDAGTATVQQGTLGGDALGYGKKVALSENGVLFVNGAGQVVFQDRTSYLTDGSSTKIKFSDKITAADTATYNDPNYTYNAAIEYQGAIGYEDIQYAGYDDRLVANVIDVAYSNGTATARDSSSYDRYRWRKQSVDTLLTTQTAASQLANVRLGRYAIPQVRVASIVANPRRYPTNGWPLLLGAEIGQGVDVIRTPIRNSTSFSIPSVVEGVRHSIDAGEKSWRVTLTLSPFEQNNYLTFDNAVRVWDSTRWGP